MCLLVFIFVFIFVSIFFIQFFVDVDSCCYGNSKQTSRSTEVGNQLKPRQTSHIISPSYYKSHGIGIEYVE